MIERTPLPATVEEALKYASKNGRIVPWARCGEHVALTCKNHPELRWSTKNIDYIGARNIFFSSNWGKKVGDGPNVDECSCSGNDLEVFVPENWQDELVPLRIVKCSCCKLEICEETSHFSFGSCEKCFAAKCAFGDGTCKVA